MTLMSRTAKVLDHDGDASDSSNAVYASWIDQPGDPRTVVELTRQDWEDLDRPTTITVTIEPGDKLNEDTP